jgi:hypothetical protein
MNKKLGVCEIIEAAQKAVGAKKVEILQENDCPALRIVLKFAYNDSIEWLLPDSEPPYTPSESHDSYNVLLKDAPKLAMFVKNGTHQNLTSVKRQTLFVQFLEALHAKDAEIVVAALVDRKFKGITDKTVTNAFPEIMVGHGKA